MAYTNMLSVAEKPRFQLNLEVLYHSKDLVSWKRKESLSRPSQAVGTADCTTQMNHLASENGLYMSGVINVQ